MSKQNGFFTHQIRHLHFLLLVLELYWVYWRRQLWKEGELVDDLEHVRYAN